MASEPDVTSSADPAQHVADVVSIASDFGAVWIVLSGLQVARGKRTASSAAIRLASTGFACLFATRTLKHHFGVERPLDPAMSTRARTPTSPAFPSGHTLAAFAAALTVPVRRRGTVLALAFAALVAWARVRVGHHRTSDVVAGAGAGLALGALLRAVLHVRAARR